MKRYPAFDPPEYVDSTPDTTLVREPEEALYEGFSEGGVLIGLENRPI